MNDHYNEIYFRRYDHYLKINLGDVPLFAKIGQWLDLKRPAKILDIGCGLGYLLHWSCFCTGAKGFGVDTSEVAVKGAHALYPNLKFILLKNNRLPFRDKSFDTIFMINLIEHVSSGEQPKLLREAGRVLKDKGILIISTPDKHSLYKKIMIHDPSHLAELSRGQLISLVSRDFTIEEMVFTNSIGRLGKNLNCLLSAIFPADLLLRLEKRK